jgi:hypothetical protein
MRSGVVDISGDLRRLAFDKISAVLGPERAERLLQRLLPELGITLATPQELFILSEAMGSLGGFEAAVGAMLGVAAIMRGASPARS